MVGESIDNIGATVMGRNMFGGRPGAWDAKKPCNGWWGSNLPFHHPAFVLTHHPRAPPRSRAERPSTSSPNGGERLFDGVGDRQGLELVRSVATPKVAHLKFARR